LPLGPSLCQKGEQLTPEPAAENLDRQEIHREPDTTPAAQRLTRTAFP